MIKNQFTINKSTLAYNNFLKLIEFYCDQNNKLKLGKNLSKYNKNLNNILKNFLNNIVLLKYYGETTFTNFNNSIYEKLKYKIMNYAYKFKKEKKNKKNYFYFVILRLLKMK